MGEYYLRISIHVEENKPLGIFAFRRLPEIRTPRERSFTSLGQDGQSIKSCGSKTGLLNFRSYEPHQTQNVLEKWIGRLRAGFPGAWPSAGGQRQSTGGTDWMRRPGHAGHREHGPA